jgi:PAS domain S-box-containing protein
MYNIQLDDLGTAVFQLDMYGKILYVNSEVTVLTGYKTNDLLGRSFNLLSVDSADHFKNDYEFNLSNKRGKHCIQGWKVRQDGEKFWSESTITPLFDEENKQVGFTCILCDISERMQADLMLRNNEERYRLLVEGVQDYSIFLLDPNGNILTWNEGGKRLSGYSANEIIGKPFSVFYTSGDLLVKKPERELEIASSTGKYEEQGWRVKKNGSLFWAGVLLTALYNDRNELVGFSKVTKDLTQQINDEARLKQSEERYRLLVEQVKDYAIFMIDEKGRIMSWNEGAKKIKGYDYDEIVGKYFSIFYTEEDILAGKPQHELKTATSTGKYEEEGWRIRKNGTKFWANVVITAVYNADGTHIGFSKVTRDLSEKRMTEQIARNNLEKYHRVAIEMEGVNVELSRANQELEQFNSIVSHDLKEPLRTVTSFLHLIDMKLQPGVDDEIKKYVGKSILAARRMKELIANLLDYAQVSKGMAELELLSLDSLMEQVLDSLKAAIDESGATVIFEDLGLETIRGERVQMVLLLQNLISNAIKFTSDKTPVVRLTSSVNNGNPLFSVSDNGIGMDADGIEKIFQVFRRLHAARNYPGTGMGLAICKKITERHHGKIWAESQPGHGSTFYFTLWEEQTFNI